MSRIPNQQTSRGTISVLCPVPGQQTSEHQMQSISIYKYITLKRTLNRREFNKVIDSLGFWPTFKIWAIRFPFFLVGLCTFHIGK